MEKHWPGKQIKFEYINMSIREVSDQLKMHFDRKNDARDGYQNCMVYSFIKKIDDKKYRVTIVMTFRGSVGKLFDKN